MQAGCNIDVSDTTAEPAERLFASGGMVWVSLPQLPLCSQGVTFQLVPVPSFVLWTPWPGGGGRAQHLVSAPTHAGELSG